MFISTLNIFALSPHLVFSCWLTAYLPRCKLASLDECFPLGTHTFQVRINELQRTEICRCGNKNLLSNCTQKIREIREARNTTISSVRGKSTSRGLILRAMSMQLTRSLEWLKVTHLLAPQSSFASLRSEDSFFKPSGSFGEETRLRQLSTSKHRSALAGANIGKAH